MASIPGLEHLEEHGWEIVGFDNVSQDEYCVGDGGRIERWICNSPSPTKRLIIRKVQHPKPVKQSWTPMFGDVVTLKRDSSNPKELIVRSNKNTVLILCVSENERRVVWANFADLVFVRRPVPESFGPETIKAIAKAVADELRGSWANRLTEPVKRSPKKPRPMRGKWMGNPPSGYRLLGPAKDEPRQAVDLYWSLSDRDWVSIDQCVEYANRDDWAACRKIETPSETPSKPVEIPKGFIEEFIDLLREPVKRSPLADGLVGVWVPAKQAEAPWTPKVGDWVKVTKPVDCAPAHKIWWVKHMDEFNGKVMQVTSVNAHSPCATLDKRAYEFDFAWLAPATDPRFKPASKHRTPTAEDLKNGPIDCEVRMLNSEAWIWRILCGIVDESERPFRTLNGRLQDSKGKWPQCRIEVK